jgi:TonB family protein
MYAHRTLPILVLLLLLPGTGCPDKDPVDQAMEDMELEIDLASVMISDEVEPTPRVTQVAATRPASGGGHAVAYEAGPTIGEDDVIAVVRKKKGKVKSCYEKELKADPGLMGTVIVAWTVSPTGSVTGISVVGNSTGNRDLEGCVKKKIGDWRFPASNGASVDIEYPFKFVPGAT